MSKYTMVNKTLHVDGKPCDPDAALRAIHPDLRIVSTPAADGGVTICVKRLGIPTLVGVGVGRSWRSGWGVVAHALTEQTEALLKSVAELCSLTPVVKATRERPTFVVGSVVEKPGRRSVETAPAAPVVPSALEQALVGLIGSAQRTEEALTKLVTGQDAILEALKGLKRK
jgi:hypothetical protein